MPIAASKINPATRRLALAILWTVTFADAGPGRTEITVR